MKLGKIFAIAVLTVFLAGTAWAGNIPEFDAVGDDSQNFFARTNGIYQIVIQNNPIEAASNFAAESFVTQAGLQLPDPCWGFLGLTSALTDAWNQGIYRWRIVLQVKPESDINVNIYDCVLKHNETNIFQYAEQTGRYRADWGQLFFVPTANPSMTVRALPGPFATPGFAPPMSLTLDARALPTLELIPMDGQLYTSKAHWPEGLVMALPQTGNTNASGQTEYNLKQGDVIEVTVAVPYNNTVDLYYGRDNVLLKYIGVIGTWYFTAG
jgi:hypothetical protein